MLTHAQNDNGNFRFRDDEFWVIMDLLTRVLAEYMTLVLNYTK